LRAVAFPPLRPAAFFCAVVPPWDELLWLEPECDACRRGYAPGEFAIRTARSLDIPLSLSASYCFSFFTFARFSGIPCLLCRRWLDPHAGEFPLEEAKEPELIGADLQ
jgi:hypothetical protein